MTQMNTVNYNKADSSATMRERNQNKENETNVECSPSFKRKANFENNLGLSINFKTFIFLLEYNNNHISVKCQDVISFK